MSHRPVILDPPSDAWPAEFASTAAAIRGALADLPIELHHIGSTAVPGIVAKPIIDILGVVPTLDALDARTERLEALGWVARGELGIPGRRFFRMDDDAGVRTHHLHVFAEGSPEITRHLDFRDWLRTHPDDAAAYAALKRSLAERFSDERGAYTDGKTEFIRSIERRAADSRRAR